MASLPHYLTFDWKARTVVIAKYYIPVLIFKTLKSNKVSVWQWLSFPYLCCKLMFKR